MKAIQDRLVSLKQEAELLRFIDDAGKKLKDHTPECPANDTTHITPPCTCGYEDEFRIKQFLGKLVTSFFKTLK